MNLGKNGWPFRYPHVKLDCDLGPLCHRGLTGGGGVRCIMEAESWRALHSVSQQTASAQDEECRNRGVSDPFGCGSKRGSFNAKPSL